MLIWAMLLVVLTSGVVISHSTFVASARKERDARYNRRAVASTFARSGLTEAVGWFRRQPNQPVLAFDPVLDSTASPPRNDTLDPTVGLVREFEIHGNLWGRYEVRREEVADISSQRGSSMPGTVWELRVRSYVYRRLDPAVAFDMAPNRMVATDAISTEVRGIQINPPAPAAINLDHARNAKIGPNAVIDGGSRPAFAFMDAATSGVGSSSDKAGAAGAGISISRSAIVTGRPLELSLPVYDSSAETVFRMQLSELREYADIVASRQQFDNDKERIELERTIVYVPDDLDLHDFDFDDVVLVVDGDLKHDGDRPSRFRGVLYVMGDAKLKAPLDFDGTLLVRGRTEIGTDDHRVEIRYEAGSVRNLRDLARQYRPRRAKVGDR